MKLGTYILRRLLLAVPVLLGVTVITFAISWQANEGDLSRAYVTEKMTLEQRAKIIDAYGFDEPWYAQYLNYLERLTRLDLGLSHSQNDRPIIDVFKEFFPATLELTLVAMIVAVVGGIALGTLTAVRKDAPIDHAARFLALAGVSVPIFWLGLLLKFGFATTYLEEHVSSGGLVGRGTFLSLCALLTVALGLLFADALDPVRRTWGELRKHALWAAGAITLLFFLGWSFLAALGSGAAIAGYAAAAALKARGKQKLPRRAWTAALGGAVVLAFGLAASPWSGALVAHAFDVIPQFPLGGRFSNDLVLEAGAHPSLTDGPTRMLLIDTLIAGDWVAFQDVARHLVLPGITLGYASLAIIARMMRSSMLEVLSLDYVRTARAKGLKESDVVRRHARRNALIPIATVVGLTFGSLLSGAVLTETIFQWPGLGRWSTQAIVAFDTNSIMSFTLFVVIIYLLANLVVDVMYSVLDPRVRLQ